MKALKNDQSRLLRQRLLMRLAIVWVLYSLLFAAAAMVFDEVISPRLGNWVADSTSEWTYFDPDYFKENYGYGELLSSYLQDTYGGTITADMVFSGAVTIVDDSGMPIPPESYLPIIEDARQETGDVKVSVDSASASEDTDAAALPQMHINELDPDALVSHQIFKVYNDMINADPSTANDWVAYGSPSGDGVFQARNLHTYNQIKAFKWPLVIAAYCIGCAIIVLISFSRILRYFDCLADAVGSVLHDRREPVELPRDLVIVQAELNGLRLESLADERAASAAEQRKNELVAYLAHDIRTPLTSVLGYLSLLQDAPDLPTEQRTRFTGLALQKAERLEALVNEFFEITRYNLQSIPIERRRIGLRFFLDQIAEEFYPQASAKGVSLQIEAPCDATFLVDGDKLARAVGNVVRNAVAYADNDTVVVLEAAVIPPKDETSPGRGDVRISVTDRGREIAPHHLETIFEKFYREDNARGGATGSAGLGLAIAKEILLAHNGSIEARSEDGVTVFTMELPGSA